MDQMGEITHRAKIEGAGASLAQGSFALSEKTADEKNAIAVTAVPTFEAGKTYLAKEPLILALDGETDAKGAVLLAPKGVKVSGKDAAVRNLTVIGDLSVSDASNIRLEQVAASSLTVSEDVCCLKMHDCRFGRVTNAGRCTVLMNTYVAGDILDTAESDTTVYGCSVDGAIKTVGNYKVLRGNTVGGGITVKGAENLLVALNLTESIKVEGSTNLSVILNETHDITAEDNVSVYICDNATDTVHVKHNDYLLADGNTFSAVWDEANENTNGDTLMDVDARLPVGADERLLPHVNRDLFLETERREYVFGDPTEEEAICVEKYIMKHAEASDRVILAPGAYAMRDCVRLEAAAKNAVIYAYGVLVERAREGETLGGLMHFSDAENILVKGMTLGFERQSCAQGYVVGKYRKGDKFFVQVIPGAGLDAEFGNTNPPDYAAVGYGPVRAGTNYTYCDAAHQGARHVENGIIEVEVRVWRYNVTKIGDIFTSKVGLGGTVITLSRSSDISFKDVTVYGVSSGFAFVECNNLTATKLYRVANTVKSGRIISKETYDRYIALGKDYGIDFEVSIDEKGRFRGCPMYIGTADATHTTGSGQGTVVVSSLFENMCDDGTNQNSLHARLASIERDPDDPSVSILTYKGNYSPSSHFAHRTVTMYCNRFRKGDRIFAYTSEGTPVCDGAALSDAEQVMGEDGTPLMTFNKPMFDRAREKNPDVAESACLYAQYRVKVKTEDVNYAAMEGYDLAHDGSTETNKIIIDNMSRSSNGFVFDNTVVRNIRSRGLLIKASEGTIQNCTFRNIGASCIQMACEIYWGESGISENIEIKNNLFDHSGYFGYLRPAEVRETYDSSIAIVGLGTKVDENFLLYKNIRIEGNVFRNRATPYAIYINSARNIDIVNNDFGPSVDEPREEGCCAVRLNAAMNIRIEGNTYSPFAKRGAGILRAEHVKNIHGDDVMIGEKPIAPDRD